MNKNEFIITMKLLGYPEPQNVPLFNVIGDDDILAVKIYELEENGLSFKGYYNSEDNCFHGKQRLIPYDLIVSSLKEKINNE